jgi:hypothetical protein
MAAARVTSVAPSRFRNLFDALPTSVRALAVKITGCGGAILTTHCSTFAALKRQRESIHGSDR